jgi:surface protein
MFKDCSSITSLDVSKWKVDKVTSAEYMFSGCKNLTVIDTSKWVANSLHSVRYMFYGCSLIEKLDISGFNTKNVTYINNMFDGCSKLKELKLGVNFTFTGNGVSRLILPTPKAKDIPGATGQWYSKTTGTAYSPGLIPSFSADTYVATP